MRVVSEVKQKKYRYMGMKGGDGMMLEEECIQCRVGGDNPKQSQKVQIY